MALGITATPSYDFKLCPFCNLPPNRLPTEIAEGVWSMGCHTFQHTANATSWVSMEDCVRIWNTRYEHSK